jgi:hypothetical protein
MCGIVGGRHFTVTSVRVDARADYGIYRTRKEERLNQDVEHVCHCVAVPRSTRFEFLLVARVCAVS